MDARWLKSQLDAHPGKSKAALARAIGLDPPAVSKILAGKRQIKAQEYLAMRAFFGLPSDGERAALRGGGTAAGQSAYVIAPLSPGMHDRADRQDEEAEPWIMPASLFENRTRAAPDKIRIFAVHGDAMAPDLSPGEQVLVDLSDTTPSPPGLFVVSDGMGPIIRQCEYVPHSDPPEIRLSARNGKYAPYTVPLRKAAISGRVIAKLQWL